MNYNLRDDVILERVSGIWMLIALRSAWENCPFALQIAPVFAFIWEEMKTGKDNNEILEKIMADRQFSEKKAQKVLDSFIRAAEEYHYFVSLEPSEC